MFDACLRPLVDRILDPVGAFVARRGVTANQVSFAGFGLGIVAAIAVALSFEIAAVLLIIPGFATDIIGFLLIFPFTRNLILKMLSSKIQVKKSKNEKFIDGEYEDLKNEDDKKL